ncbi:hypothetical protein CRG98_019827 [Punica granatum]|uniref:RNase H type-1 domain-containing protein n=1 Tax=Punica granatum TaxID=22663 RepID=A0A2I0JTZ3_PUNGR|nr:hypothetical protein CRG98_019827 [Punica granatum]
MISIAAIGEDEDTQKTPIPFVINHAPTEVAIAAIPFVIEVLAKEPYQDSRVPWTYEAVPEAVPLLTKKVTYLEAEAFMKVIKASEYKVVEQMGQSPAHISLLALLLSSELHRNALLKILTAAQVPKDTAQDRIEETVNSIFSNQISFADDELPSEEKSLPIYFGEGLDEDGRVPEIEESLHRLENHQLTSIEPTEEINIGTTEEQRTLRIGTSLDPVQRARMIDFLTEYQEKNGKVRVCINFPLPHIDVLVDNTARHTQFSFMDGFSGYNQIQMAEEDKIKTTFITMWGMFCYKVMPFGLKNAEATYQRAMVTLFHDMMHKEIEVYVDSMIVKSKEAVEWDDEYQKAFDTVKAYLVQPPVLVPPSPDLKIDFPCTNNIAEYEACILDLQAAIDLKVKELKVFGDSMLTIFQTLKQWKTKDPKLASYHEYLEELTENFEDISFTYTPRMKNQFADALATLASMVSITKENLIEPLEFEIAQGPAHCDVLMQLTANRAHFFLSSETLYRCSLDATLLRCVDENEAQPFMEEVHEGNCGPHMNGLMPAKKLMRLGCF